MMEQKKPDEIDGSELLQYSTYALSKFFPKEPEKGHVHIIVQVPSTGKCD
jgi:hypothetical protein